MANFLSRQNCPVLLLVATLLLGLAEAVTSGNGFMAAPDAHSGVQAAPQASPNEPERCVICQEEMRNDEELRELPCPTPPGAERVPHRFHAACVHRWLVEAPTAACPICFATADPLPAAEDAERQEAQQRIRAERLRRAAGEAHVASLRQIVQNAIDTYREEALRRLREAQLRERLRQDGMQLANLDPEQRADEMFVTEAVTENGLALQHAAEALRGNRRIVHWAVMQNGMALQYASAELCADEDIVFSAVLDHGMVLQYASAQVRNNSFIVRAAVDNDGLALQYASASLRADPFTVYLAVRQNADAGCFSLILQDSFLKRRLQSVKDFVACKRRRLE